MFHEQVYRRRIQQFSSRLRMDRYPERRALKVEYCYDHDAPIPYSEIESRTWREIGKGDEWGTKWGSAWFRFHGSIPDEWRGKKIIALIDITGEAAVWKNGSPWVGLTHVNVEGSLYRKCLVPVLDTAKGGENIQLLAEGAANDMFGQGSPEPYLLREADLAVVDSPVWTLEQDYSFLLELLQALSPETARYRRVISGLNHVANIYPSGRIDECLAVTRELIQTSAGSSDMTVYGIGHGHLDLAWLWPVRETKRKTGRTFASQLRYLEEYPGYVFGASQPQQYQWLKEEYPSLYERVKKAVSDGRWECQGGMWVEADTNVTGGESLVRQCMYGRKFFREEFGVEVRDLWLPDVFGYSASLPQILTKCGVDVFVTQKISWNDTNVFPHHTFQWKGIDGTRILSHFLPANDYNSDNAPIKLKRAEDRYAQKDVCDGFLHLYGVGDGGGGPGRRHIERGIRAADCEGLPKFRFSAAEKFYEYLRSLPSESLPGWAGELYLELHRGTYTTHARMKKRNRRIEQELRDVEFLSVVAGEYPAEELEKIWKNVLLNQFHDIIPGSSIDWVYRDAHALYDSCQRELEILVGKALRKLLPLADIPLEQHYAVVNTLSWDRMVEIAIPRPESDADKSVVDAQGNALETAYRKGFLCTLVPVGSMGYTTIRIDDASSQTTASLSADSDNVENELVSVRFGDRGTITSIYDKELGREMLRGPANRLVSHEDLPVKWEAWDINHYYAEADSVEPEMVERTVHYCDGVGAAIRQTLRVGKSTINQEISLRKGSPEVRIKNDVDWRDSQRLLRVYADTAIQATEASYEIQFGLLRRPTHVNTSWDAARFEVCGHRFVDLSEPDAGLALLNDSKYGHRCVDGSLELSLIRAPKSKRGEQIDLERHEFTYSYYPHAGDLARSDVRCVAHELNAPMQPIPLSHAPKQTSRSVFRLSTTRVSIDTVKQSENGEGIVLRMYETMGGRTWVRLETDLPVTRATETNLEEQPTGEIVLDGRSCELEFGPFEIKTIRLTLR